VDLCALMTRDQARQLAQREVDTISKRGGIPVALDEDATIERDWCWVFIYQSRAFLDSGRERDRLAGNSPIVIHKATANVYSLGTARSIDEQLDRLKREVAQRREN